MNLHRVGARVLASVCDVGSIKPLGVWYVQGIHDPKE